MAHRDLGAFIDAMLAPDTTPAQILEIGRMAEEGDFGDDDEPDEDDGPTNPQATARVRAMIDARVNQRLDAKFGRREKRCSPPTPHPYRRTRELYEQAPLLTDEDEAILDRVWERRAQREAQKKADEQRRVGLASLARARIGIQNV
jgi:hypothetical protein